MYLCSSSRVGWYYTTFLVKTEAQKTFTAGRCLLRSCVIVPRLYAIVRFCKAKHVETFFTFKLYMSLCFNLTMLCSGLGTKTTWFGLGNANNWLEIPGLVTTDMDGNCPGVSLKTNFFATNTSWSSAARQSSCCRLSWLSCLHHPVLLMRKLAHLNCKSGVKQIWRICGLQKCQHFDLATGGAAKWNQQRQWKTPLDLMRLSVWHQRGQWEETQPPSDQ